jgi:hypothetical protein
VQGSLASQSSRSPKSTSLRSPSDTMREKPMLRDLAQSSTAVTSAPDCDTKAMSPASASVCAKLALRPRCGVSRPRQFGPSTRSRCGRAASSVCCFCAAVRPAVITIAARVPSAPSAATRPGIVAGGVHSTAMSGGAGRASTVAWQGWPSSSLRDGLTACTGPLKAPARRLRHTVAPTLPGRSDAPTTATEAGSSRRSRWRIVIARAARRRRAVQREVGSS